MKSVIKRIGSLRKKADNNSPKSDLSSGQNTTAAIEAPKDVLSKNMETGKQPEAVEQNTPPNTQAQVGNQGKTVEKEGNNNEITDDRPINKVVHTEPEPEVPIVTGNFVPANSEPANSEPAPGIITGGVKTKGGEAFQISMTSTEVPRPMTAKRPMTANRSTKQKSLDENQCDSEDMKAMGESGDDITEEEVEKEALQKCKEAFSHDVAYNLQSTQWANRKDAIETINSKILGLKGPIQEGTEINPTELKETFTIALHLTRRALKDPVAPVCFSAFELFRNAIKVFCPILDTSMPIKNVCGSLVGPLLLKMSGEATGTNRRNQKEACKCLLRLARTPQVEGLGIIVSMLSDDSLPHRPRLSLLKLLINEFGFSKGPGLRLQMVMAITLPAMQIADDKTRKAAVGVIVAAYEVGGKRVLKHLNSVKPAMLKIIHRKLKESDEARGVVDSPFFTDPSPTQERPKTGVERPKTGGPRRIQKQADEMQLAGKAYLPHLDPNSSPVLQQNQSGPESDHVKKSGMEPPSQNNAIQHNDGVSPTSKKQMMREKQFEAIPGSYGNGGNVWTAPS